MPGLLAQITSVGRSYEEVRVVVDAIKTGLSAFSQNTEISANRNFLIKIATIRRYLPNSEKDFNDRKEEVFDVLKSAHSLILEIQNYLYYLRRGRIELRVEETEDVYSVQREV